MTRVGRHIINPLIASALAASVMVSCSMPRSTLSVKTRGSLLSRATEPTPTPTATSAAVDTTAPSVVITSNRDPGPTTNADMTLTIAFSESVVDCDASDVTIVNASAGTLTVVDAMTYSLAITPSVGTITADIAADACHDAAGNGNAAAAQWSIVYDSATPAIASISGVDGSYKAGAHIDVDVVWNRAITLTGTASTLTLTGARTAAYFSKPAVDTIRYRYTVQAGDNASDITVSAFSYNGDSVADSNGIAATSSALPASRNLADTSNVNLDTTAPTVTITASPSSGPTNVAPIILTAQFSEPVTGFTTGDITVSNASKGTFTAVDADTFTLAITPSSDGTVTADIAGAAAQDVATNNSFAATQWSIVYDHTPPTISSISATSATYKAGATIDIDVNFSETINVTGTSSSLTLTGTRTASYVSTLDSDTIRYRYTVQAGDTAADITVVSMNVGGGVIADLAGNVATLTMPGTQNLADTSDVHLDTTAPTIAITASPSGNPTNAASITLTAQFSEPVTGFTAGDITVSNGSKGTFTAVDGDTYTLVITPTSAGLVTADIAAAAAVDIASNSSTAATQWSTTYDNVDPTVTITASPSVNPTGASSITLTAQFSEPVTGLTTGDIMVSNASKGTFTAVDGDTYTLVIAPTSAGLVTADIASAAAQDSAGNDSVAATQWSTTYDNTAPTIVSITGTTGSYKAADTVDVDVNFSSSVTLTGTSSTLTLTGSRTAAYLSKPDADTIRYRYTVQAGDNATDITVTAFNINTDTVLSALGNAATTTLPVGQNLSDNADVNLDTTRPTTTITSSRDPGPTNQSSILLTITFSESVTGFSTGYVVVSNATKGTFTAVNASTYTLAITPTSSTILTASVGAYVGNDAAGNGNTAATQWSITYDGTNPTIGSVTGTSSYYKQGATIDVDVNFSKSVTLTGTASTLTLTGSRTATYQSTVDTDTIRYRYTVQAGDNVNNLNVTAFNINTDTIRDAVGNDATVTLPVGTNLADTSSVHLDTTAPTVTISSTTSLYTNVTPIPITITFSESVSGFTAGALTVTNGTKGALSGSGSSYTIDVTPSGQTATLTFDISAGVAMDTAANLSTVATQLTRYFDNANLTVSITSGASDPTATRPIPVTITFNKSVSDFVVGDITVTNGSAGNFAGSGTTYSADITPTNADPTEGTITVAVAGSVATDANLNGNVAATNLTRDYDTKGPVPGNSGTITSSNVATTSLTLDWTKATDGVSAQSALLYEVRKSSSNNMATVANAESNGVIASAYATDINTAGMGSLSASTTYYFTVIVKDAMGNKSVYATASVATAAPPLGAFAITGPSSSTSDATPDITWGSSSGATKYDVLIDDTTACASPTYSYTDVASTTQTSGSLADGTYYVCVTAKDNSGNSLAASNTNYTFTLSTTPAQPLTAGGSGVITVSNITTTSLSLAWTAASDGDTAESALQYIVYQSPSNNITTVANAKLNGTAIGSYTAGMTSKSITGLSPGTEYYFNVLVKDSLGNEEAYAMVATTSSAASAPVPGGSGAVAATWNGSAVTLTWTVATDDVSAQSALSYKIVYSTTNSLGSVNGAIAGTTITDWTANISTAVTSSLVSGSTYYFNVIVKDEAGNMAVYNPIQYTLEFHSPLMTSSSAERKTFYDSSSAKHWAFWYSGTNVRYSYSSDGTSYTQSGVLSGITTPRFAVASKNGTVIIAYESNYDIVITRGGITGTSISWPTTSTALDAAGSSDNFTKPAVAIGADDHVYVGGYQLGSTTQVYATRIVRSSGIYTAALSWQSTLSAGQSGSPGKNLAIVPQGTTAMAFTSASDGAVTAYTYDDVGGTWNVKSGSVAGWSVLTPLEGVDAVVYDMVQMGSDLYVAGNFISAGGVLANRIAKWDGDSWSALGSGMNNNIFALAVYNGELYAGGQFSTAGSVTTSGIAKWNGVSWSAVGNGTGAGITANQIVYTLRVIGSRLYAGGSFSAVDGVAAKCIAQWDGNTWAPVGNGLTSTVMAIASSGTDMYVGGSFACDGAATQGGTYPSYTCTGGYSVLNYVAKWSGSGWLPLGSGLNQVAQAMAYALGKLYVKGNLITLAGGTAVTTVAQWDPAANAGAGAWSALGSGLPSHSNGMIVPSGTDVYFGGIFTTAGGVSANAVARWDTLTNSWNAVGAGLTGAVNSLAVIDGTLYAGGTFSASGSSPVTNIAKWDGSSWKPLGGIGGASVNAIAIHGTDVYVGGTISSIGNTTVNNIAKWDGSGWSAMGAGFDGPVYALAVIGSDLYAGGSFTCSGGASKTLTAYPGTACTGAGAVLFNFIAKWSTTTSQWSAITAGSTVGVGQAIYSLVTDGTDLYLGGYFTSINGITGATKIAKLTPPATWAALGMGVSPASAFVYSVGLSGGKVYIGGRMTGVKQPNATTVTVANIAQWDIGTSTWSAMGSGMSPTAGVVYALAPYGGLIYAAGAFTSAGGNTANYVAAWDPVGGTWSAVGSGLDGVAYGMMVSGGNLYVAGSFTTAGGNPAFGTAKWNGSAWSALANAPGVPAKAFASDGTKLYLVGGFGIGQYTTNIVARTSKTSVASDASGVHLAYVDSASGLPYYMTFDGTSWGAANALGSNVVDGGIALATSADSSQWLVAWERAAQIEYRKYSATAWGSVTAATASSRNHHPTLPMTINTTAVPIVWTMGVADPFTLGSSVISFP